MNTLKYQRFELWKERSHIRKQMHLMMLQIKEQNPGEDIGGLLLHERSQALRLESDIRSMIEQNFENKQMGTPPVCIRTINEPI